MNRVDDAGRSASASRYVLREPLTARLDTVLAVVAATLAFPTVRVNILDATRQHTVRMLGPGSPDSVGRDEALCDAVVRSGHPVIVQDAAHDRRFAGHPPVVGGEIGAYLGVPLKGPDDEIIGALCTIDATHRTITAHQLRMLLQFGTLVERQLEAIRVEDALRVTPPTAHRIPPRRFRRGA